MTKILPLILFPILLFGCGERNVATGGGGASVAAATAPVLYEALLAAQPAAPPGQIPVQVILDYADAGGDLNGGVVFYSINGGPFTPRPLTATNATTRTNAPAFTIFVDNPISGTIPIRFFVKDRQAVQSNTVTAFLTQPPAP